MPKTPKGNSDKREALIDKADTWAEDQREKGYYYDDSHGYETYRPGIDDDEREGERPEDDTTNRPHGTRS